MSLTRTIARSLDRRDQAMTLAYARKAIPKTESAALALAGNTSRRVRRLARSMFDKQLVKYEGQGCALTQWRRDRLAELNKVADDVLARAPASENYLVTQAVAGTIDGVPFPGALVERDWLRTLTARPSKRMVQKTAYKLAQLEGQLKSAEG